MSIEEKKLENDPNECSDGGFHEPDWTSLTHSGVVLDPIFYVTCKICGRNGSIWMNVKDVNW